MDTLNVLTMLGWLLYTQNTTQPVPRGVLLRVGLATLWSACCRNRVFDSAQSLASSTNSVPWA
eukprot:2007798-Amphidinium_carterae.2